MSRPKEIPGGRVTHSATVAITGHTTKLLGTAGPGRGGGGGERLTVDGERPIAHEEQSVEMVNGRARVTPLLISIPPHCESTRRTMT